jgi:serine/threonine protein kinase
VYAVDSAGRSAIKFAIPKNQIAMESTFLWFTKYRLLEARPEHISATCYVYKATDGNSEDSPRVALKLMKSGAQFLREHRARMTEFSEDYVVSVTSVYNPYFPDENQIRRYQEEESNFPDVVDFEKWGQSGKQLSKEQAEKCYCLVMPLANRNMFVSLKQDRFAGEKLDEIRLVLTQLLKAVEHMHSKGFLHADLKPLNLVRTDMSWRLIDLDASCQIGEEATLSKTSTAYIPPEAYYLNKDANICDLRTRVNYEKILDKFPDLNLDPFFLQANPSFDVWSLGCIFYQLCSAAVQPLFQADRDDNISENIDDDDSKWSLAEWSDEIKEQKLRKIAVNEARNLVSQMLSKDPKHRPTIARVLQHPFLTKLKVARLQGEEAEHDIFLSYRVASDAKYADRLYHELKACGFKVWMDAYSLVVGEPWKEGFCKAIVNCKNVVCILSRGAINSPDNPACNYGKLESTSKCDNVLLEQTLACELHGLGIVEKIHPILIGDLNGSVFSDFFLSGCCPQAPDVRVVSVEKDVQYVMQQQALGCPLENRSVKKVLDSILSFHGCKLVGEMDEAFAKTIAAIKSSFHSSSNTKTNVLDRSPEIISELQLELEQMRLENKKLSEELAKYDHTYASTISSTTSK